MNRKTDEEKERVENINPWSYKDSDTEDFDTEEERIQAERERNFFKVMHGCNIASAVILTIIVVLLFLLTR